MRQESGGAALDAEPPMIRERHVEPHELHDAVPVARQHRHDERTRGAQDRRVRRALTGDEAFVEIVLGGGEVGLVEVHVLGDQALVVELHEHGEHRLEPVPGHHDTEEAQVLAADGEGLDRDGVELVVGRLVPFEVLGLAHVGERHRGPAIDAPEVLGEERGGVVPAAGLVEPGHARGTMRVAAFSIHG